MIKDHRSKACVFRGHNESSYTKNQGNYIELIKLLATYNDKVPGVVLTNAPQNAKYTSSQIQNEILDIFPTKV
jgi:asparagine N-glycosylation enzyme membrane subunit Stt3